MNKIKKPIRHNRKPEQRINQIINEGINDFRDVKRYKPLYEIDRVKPIGEIIEGMNDVI